MRGATVHSLIGPVSLMPWYKVDIDEREPVQGREQNWSGVARSRTTAEEAAYQAWEARFGVGSVPTNVNVRVTATSGAPRGRGDALSNERRQRAVEDLAVQAGKEYARAENRTERAASKQIIVDELIPQAAAAGIRFVALAELLGINLRTLQAWRHAGERDNLEQNDARRPAC